MPVYFVSPEGSDAVKIGWTRGAVSVRLCQLQGGHQSPLTLLREIDGSAALEKSLHRHFSDHRISREWFRLVPDMLTIKSEDLTPPPAPSCQDKGWNSASIQGSRTTRLNLVLSNELYRDLDDMAKYERTTMTNVFRVAFALYKVCHQAKKDGQHIGLVFDRDKLDRELVGLI